VNSGEGVNGATGAALPAAPGRRPPEPALAGGSAAQPHPLRRCALLGAVASALTIVLLIVAPFEHGVWLLAYLFLVGFAAPLLLATGERGLLAEPLEGNGANRLAAAWLTGMVLVPAGVLLDVRLPVVLGALALLVALWSLAQRAFGGGARPARAASPRDRRLQAGARRGHAALIVFMAASTLIGVLLAWDSPWI
jgi:hypothetical protein